MEEKLLPLFILLIFSILVLVTGCTSTDNPKITEQIPATSTTLHELPLPEPTLEDPGDMWEKVVFLTHSIGKSNSDGGTINGTAIINKTGVGGYRVISEGSETDGRKFVTGEVRNNNPFPVVIKVKVDFIDAHDDIIGGGFDTISKLESGQSANFKVYVVNLTWTIYDRTEWERSYYSWNVYIDEVTRFTPTPTSSGGLKIITSDIVPGENRSYILKGTVINENSYTVSASIKGEFMDENHVIIEDGMDTINNLAPGQVYQFKIPYVDGSHDDPPISYWKVWIASALRECTVICPTGETLTESCECASTCNGKVCKVNEKCCNGNCISCPMGESLGPDCWCYTLCGSEICKNDETCCGGRCVKCTSGYGLGADCLCHPLCNGLICDYPSKCCNGQCLKCGVGYILGSDCLCHKACTATTYCDQGTCCGDKCCLYGSTCCGSVCCPQGMTCYDGISCR